MTMNNTDSANGDSLRAVVGRPLTGNTGSVPDSLDGIVKVSQVNQLTDALNDLRAWCKIEADKAYHLSAREVWKDVAHWAEARGAIHNIKLEGCPRGVESPNRERGDSLSNA